MAKLKKSLTKSVQCSEQSLAELRESQRQKFLNLGKKRTTPRRNRHVGQVKCFGCQRWQKDQGRAATCVHCGFQPLPSRDYEPNCCYHPDYHK